MLHNVPVCEHPRPTLQLQGPRREPEWGWRRGKWRWTLNLQNSSRNAFSAMQAAMQQTRGGKGCRWRCPRPPRRDRRRTDGLWAKTGTWYSCRLTEQLKPTSFICAQMTFDLTGVEPRSKQKYPVKNWIILFVWNTSNAFKLYKYKNIRIHQIAVSWSQNTWTKHSVFSLTNSSHQV